MFDSGAESEGCSQLIEFFIPSHAFLFFLFSFWDVQLAQ